ncbi:MAG: hypothetical protein K2P86_13515 [Xanthobacteraceae bacterium]|nr:hypothetical protein [Xanthobacteraceae bacterium]
MAAIENGLKKFKYLYSYELNGKEYINRFSSLGSGYKVRDDFYKQSKVLLPNFSEDQICRFCLLLAKLDHFRRGTTVFHLHKAMKKGVFDLQEMMLDCEESWIQDIKQLTAAYKLANVDVFSKKLSVKHGAVLAGSADVGGADLDLVVNGCLVEIKATVKPKVPTNLLRQLVGYWLLDYEDELNIQSARIDFVRQNHQVLLGKEMLFSGLRSKKTVRSEFKMGLRSQNR